jgi:hypothetical protein
MDTRRSFYLASRQDDFAEAAADASRLDFSDIPYVVPANDNLRSEERLSSRCGNMRRNQLRQKREGYEVKMSIKKRTASRSAKKSARARNDDMPLKGGHHSQNAA